MRKPLYFLSFLFVLYSCASLQKKTTSVFIKYNNEHIVYEGRTSVNAENSATEIYWSGSSIALNFKGTSLQVKLNDQNGTNYFNVIVDGKLSEVLKLEKGLKTYAIAKDLSNKKHRVLLTKRNEWTYGKTEFYGFSLVGKSLKPNPPKELHIEFYGDSITAGHGNEDYSGNDKPEGNVTNNYNTYAAITARNLNAEYTCIARGGIGIMVSWFNMIMPEMYDRLNPSDANSKWDFSKKKVDIVVINLFQNDSWIVNHPNHVEFKRRFGTEKPDAAKIIASYKNFIGKIRKEYKETPIVCVLGNMDITKEDSLWPSYVQQAVAELNDSKIATCFVPYKNTGGHPKVEEHKLAADALTKVILDKKFNKI